MTKKISSSAGAGTTFSIGHILLYILAAVITAAILFLLLDNTAGTSKLASGWQNTANFMGAVVGIPVTLVASLVALVLAINSLGISRAQQGSDIVAAVSVQFSEAVDLFKTVALDIGQLISSDRKIRKHLEASVGGSARGGISGYDLHKLQADDGYTKLHYEFLEAKGALSRSLIGILSNPMAMSLITAMERRRLSEGVLLHPKLAKHFASNPEISAVFSWHFSKTPSFKEFMRDFLIGANDDITFTKPEEGINLSKTLFIFVNNVGYKYGSNWMSDPEMIPGIRIYYTGGRILWQDYEDKGVVNYGAVFLHDLAKLFPNTDACAEVLLETVKQGYNFDLDREIVKTLVSHVELDKIAEIVSPTRGVEKNWGHAFVGYIPKAPDK